MADKTNLGKELMGLGKDLAAAVKKMKSSKEFKTLESEVAKAIKSVSASMWVSLKAAQRSPATKKIQNRLNKVITEGKKQGVIELNKAQKAAAQTIRKARVALKNIKSKKDA